MTLQSIFTSLLLLLVAVISALQQPVAVIGATGRLGRLAVQELVNRGIPCQLLVRKIPSSASHGSQPVPESLEDCKSSDDLLHYFQLLPNVTLIEGDVTTVESLTVLVQNCSACLALWGATRRSKISDLWKHRQVEDSDMTHAKQVNYQGVVNLISACQASKTCNRIVRITGKGEDPTSFFSVLINALGSMAKAWNYQGEQALREAAATSTLEYTIVRPGVMSSDAPRPPNATLLLGDNGADLPVSPINYQDIATLCVESLEYLNAANCTLTAMTAKDDDWSQNGATSWNPLLEKVRTDTRGFPSDMLEQHYKAVRNVIKGIGTFMVFVLTAIVAKITIF